VKLPLVIHSIFDRFVNFGPRFFQELSTGKSSAKDSYKSDDLTLNGTLAAAIEHDMRTPLANLHSDLYFLQKDLVNNARVKSRINRIKAQVERLEAILSLNHFIRGIDTYSPKFLKISLRDLIHTAVKQLKGSSNYPPGLFFSFRDKPHVFVAGDFIMLEQAFINLLKNAAEAMDFHGDVRINFSVDRHAKEVKTEIIDGGVGISDEIIEQITKPGFSTKNTQRGLGLFISKSIFGAHGGRIEFMSQIGKGTTVFVYLPICPGDMYEKASVNNRR